MNDACNQTAFILILFTPERRPLSAVNSSFAGGDPDARRRLLLVSACAVSDVEIKHTFQSLKLIVELICPFILKSFDKHYHPTSLFL